jgi:hypothetical protein
MQSPFKFQSSADHYNHSIPASKDKLQIRKENTLSVVGKQINLGDFRYAGNQNMKKNNYLYNVPLIYIYFNVSVTECCAPCISTFAYSFSFVSVCSLTMLLVPGTI